VKIVEGRIENFTPYHPTAGYKMESFMVKGYRFEYSEYRTTAGFNQTTANGGPIWPGKRVRVTFLVNQIARLEIVKYNAK